MEKLLEAPDESGYSVKENATAVSSQSLDGGMPRTRLDEIGGSRIISLQWSGSKKRYNTVRQFLNDNLGLGCPQFAMDLVIATGDYQEYVCNVLPDTINAAPSSNLAWMITAQFEVLPRDDEPIGIPASEALFSEEFIDGLTGYSQISGSPTASIVSTIYGKTINIASQNAATTISSIEKTLTSISVSYIEWKFRIVGAINDDDAGTINFFNASINVLSFNPAREAAFDFSRKPFFQCLGTVYQVAPSELVSDNWYKLTFSIGVVSTITMTDLTTGLVIYVNVIGSVIPLQFDAISFSADKGGFTSVAQYTDIYSANGKLSSPDFASYNLADSINNRETVNYGLSGKFNRNYLNGCVAVTASWTTDLNGYNALAQTYRSCIAGGGYLFDCDLLIEGTELKTYQCSFIIGTFSLVSVQGETYNVNAQLAVDTTPYDVVNNPWISDSALSIINGSVDPASYTLTVNNVNLIPSIIRAVMDFVSYALSYMPNELSLIQTVPFIADAASYSFSPKDITLTNAQNPLIFNTQNGNYTLVAADVDNKHWIRMNSGSANTLTVPTNAAVPCQVGTTVLGSQYGTGATTVVGDTGVTIRKSRTGVLSAQYAAFGITKIATDEWEAFGDFT